MAVETSGTQRKRSSLPARVAESIEHAVREGAFAPDALLPSHRELCRLHGVSLKTVRKALDILEERGVLYRRERSGTYVHPAAVAPRAASTQANLACINFVERDQPASRSALRTDYLMGYTDALEHLDVKMRFVRWMEGEDECGALLSDRFAPETQGCVLLNITPPRLMWWLAERRIPFVVQFFRHYSIEDLPPHPRVYVNKVGAGWEATRYLMGLGHQRIGFAGAVPEEQDAPGLYFGYRAALLSAGSDHRRDDILPFLTDEVDVALRPVRRFLERNGHLTAIVCQTDAMAIAILRVAQTLGIRVPEDLSVIGFNDLPEAAQANPPLTTMASPRRALARAAVEMLLSSAQKPPEDYETRVLNCHLMIRKSTAAPGRKGEAQAG
jgi:DNA-binding LacI/PurR family transcriptional regulator